MFTPTYLSYLEVPPDRGVLTRVADWFHPDRRDENVRRLCHNRDQFCELQAEAATLVYNEHVRLQAALVPSIDELRALTPYQFETEIARMFTRLGYTVRQTPYTNDFGRDAIMTKDGNTYLVECKCYKSGGLSGRPALQKFHSAIMTDGATSGFFVTTGGFSEPAAAFAKGCKIELIDANALVRLMMESNPTATNDTRYNTMCRWCGDVVGHDLHTPQTVTCRNGHTVEPSLSHEKILKIPRPPERGYVHRLFTEEVRNMFMSLPQGKCPDAWW